MNSFYRGIFFGLLLQSATPGNARTYNYEDVPIGERSFGMGHASMALSGDVSNMFYNPATLAYGDSSQVSASLSTYARIDTRTGEFVSLFKSARDNIKRGGFLAIPSMVGGNLKWGDWQWGGSVLVPYMYANSGTVDINSQDAAAFESEFTTVWIGAFLARKYGKHNFGLSLFYASHDVNEKFFFVTTSVTPFSIRFLEKTTSSSSAVAVLGGTYELSDSWTMGYSARVKGFPIGGYGEYSDAVSGTSTGAVADSFTSTFVPFPNRMSLGVSNKTNNKLTLAADFHFYFPVKGNFKNGGTSELFNIDAKAILNTMLGAEYFFKPGLGFRAGIYSNMSSAKTVPTYLTAIDDKVHMFGGTAAIVFDKPTGSISLGAYGIGGQGSSGTLSQTPTNTARSNYIYGFVVASNYKF